MRHRKSGRKLNVSSPHRKAMFRSMALALIERERIRTTPARAKELRQIADRVITFGKRADLSARRSMVKLLGSTQTKQPGQNRVRLAMDRVYKILVPRFAKRAGGYTQILRLPNFRSGDMADMCLIQYLPEDGEKTKKSKKATAAPADKKEKQAAAPKTKEKKKVEAAPQDKPVKGKKST